jgi:ribosomal protein L37AE/L43A
MSLDEVEAFHRSLKACPKCGSNEGFWLTPRRHTGYVQCKHCGAILEPCETFSIREGVQKKSGQDKRGILR